MDEEHSAIEAGQILGIPQILTTPVEVNLNQGEGLNALAVPNKVAENHKAIVSRDEKGEYTILSIVGKDYVVPSHHGFIEAWDSATGGASIETMGLLGKGGETLFISTKLPTFDVRGDEVNNYLMAFNPLNGESAVTGRETPVRVVCQNTLNFSASDCVQEFRAIHVGVGATLPQIHRWLKELWEMRQAQAETIRETFEILAGRQVNETEAHGVIDAVYSYAEMPELLPTASKEQFENRCEVVQKYNQGQDDHRVGVFGLFAGAGTGMNHPATNGTAWGLYNAFTEYEGHARKNARARSKFIGVGAERMAAGFKGCLELVK